MREFFPQLKKKIHLKLHFKCTCFTPFTLLGHVIARGERGHLPILTPHAPFPDFNYETKRGRPTKLEKGSFSRRIYLLGLSRERVWIERSPWVIFKFSPVNVKRGIFNFGWTKPCQAEVMSVGKRILLLVVWGWKMAWSEDWPTRFKYASFSNTWDIFLL